MFEIVRGESLDNLFSASRSGDRDAFAQWMARMEIPLRRALSRFARHVDVEVAVQETFLRMWVLANDSTRSLQGENASARFAFVVARNVAFEEMRRTKAGQSVNLDELENFPEGRIEPHLPDPALQKVIFHCIESLPRQPRNALQARTGEGQLPDRQLAEKLRMRLNTFLQNVVRARRLVRECLEKHGVRLEEVAS